MKKIVTIIVTFLTVNLSCAQEIEKLSPSLELMKLLKFENTLINTSKLGFAPFFNQLRTKGMPEEAIQELMGVSDIYFKQVASDPDLKKEMAGIYEEKFNKDVANLVDGVSKLDQLNINSRAQTDAENFQKMIHFRKKNLLKIGLLTKIIFLIIRIQF